MALRKCASCGNDLPAGATARAKFCSVTCRTRAHKAKAAPATLALVPPVPAPASEPAGTRLEALEATAARLNRLLDEADPRSAAPLNKEYRDTLRELDGLREAAAAEGRGHGTSSGTRRPFSASAI